MVELIGELQGAKNIGNTSRIVALFLIIGSTTILDLFSVKNRLKNGLNKICENGHFRNFCKGVRKPKW